MAVSMSSTWILLSVCVFLWMGFCNAEDMNNEDTTQDSTEPPVMRCYSCTHSYNPFVNATCVTNPELIPGGMVICDNDRVCTVNRQWDKGEGVIRSFRRGCDEYNDQRDNCVESVYFIDCVTYCDGDLCNDGDGIPITTPKPPNPTIKDSASVNTVHPLIVGLVALVVSSYMRVIGNVV